MMKFFYSLNTILRPYRRVIYKVTNFISNLIILLIGFVLGVLVIRTNVIEMIPSCLNLYNFPINFGDITINFRSIIIFIFLLQFVVLAIKVILKKRKDD